MSDLSLGVLQALHAHEDAQPHRAAGREAANKRATEAQKAHDEREKAVKPDAVSGVNKEALPTSGPLAQMLDAIPTRPGIEGKAQELEKWQAFNAKRFTDAQARQYLARQVAVSEQRAEQARAIAAQNVSRPGVDPALQLQLQSAPMGPSSPGGRALGILQR